jgi:hypothetical protein
MNLVRLRLITLPPRKMARKIVELPINNTYTKSKNLSHRPPPLTANSHRAARPWGIRAETACTHSWPGRQQLPRGSAASPHGLPATPPDGNALSCGRCSRGQSAPRQPEYTDPLKGSETPKHLRTVAAINTGCFQGTTSERWKRSNPILLSGSPSKSCKHARGGDGGG